MTKELSFWLNRDKPTGYKDVSTETFEEFSDEVFNFYKISKSSVVFCLDFKADSSINNVYQEIPVDPGSVDVVIKTPYAYAKFHQVYIPLYYDRLPQYLDNESVFKRLFSFVSDIASGNQVCFSKQSRV